MLGSPYSGKLPDRVRNSISLGIPAVPNRGAYLQVLALLNLVKQFVGVGFENPSIQEAKELTRFVEAHCVRV